MERGGEGTVNADKCILYIVYCTLCTIYVYEDKNLNTVDEHIN